MFTAKVTSMENSSCGMGFDVKQEIKEEPLVNDVYGCVTQELSDNSQDQKSSIKLETIYDDTSVQGIPQAGRWSLQTQVESLDENVGREHHTKLSLKEEYHKAKSCAIDQDSSMLSTEEHINTESHDMKIAVNLLQTDVDPCQTPYSFSAVDNGKIFEQKTSSQDQYIVPGEEMAGFEQRLTYESLNKMSFKNEATGLEQRLTYESLNKMSFKNEAIGLEQKVTYGCESQDIMSVKNDAVDVEPNISLHEQNISDTVSEDLKHCIELDRASSPPLSGLECNTSSEEKDRADVSPLKSYKCEICEKAFKSKSSVRKHKVVHQEARPHVCEVCSKTFKCRKGLREHKVIHSEGVRCEFCDKAFKNKNNLLIHKEVVHSDKRPFTCEECNRAFKHKNYLDKHKIVHSEVRAFKCDMCNKSFKQKMVLDKHRLVHSEARPFTCEVCSKTFKQKFDLSRHVMTHSEVRAFQCEVCERTFTQYSYLYKHRKVHSKVKKGYIKEGKKKKSQIHEI